MRSAAGLAVLLALWPGPPAGVIPGARHLVAIGSTAPATQAPAGRVDTATFWSQSLGVRKRLLVWLPPSYDRAPERRYPVAIYLHGIWGSETDWTSRASLHRILDSLVAAGLPELIVAMPEHAGRLRAMPAGVPAARR
jgi:enterochelin esterase-like enzyme